MVTNAPLVWFRILFGFLMLVESWGALATGWVGAAFVEPRFTFPLHGFEFLRVLSGPRMYAYFAVMGVCAIGVMLGYRYRASAHALAVLWTGAYLAQKTHYNNHYYLAVIVTWAMAWLPAHRSRSMDVRARRVPETDVCHPWIARAFRAQLLIVFTYAAIAKLYPGWLNGEYLRVNLGAKGDRWLLGPLVVESWFQTFTIYAAILFDATVILFLMWRPTRWFAFAGLVAFNLFNSIVFQIGIFPYMVIAMTVFFFEDLFRAPRGGATVREPVRLRRGVRLAALFVLGAQILLPLRHHLIPGDVTWREEGHRMSWRMMLRTKAGSLVLVAEDRATGEVGVVPQEEFLTDKQRGRVATQPEFLYQFVQVLKEHYRDEGVEDLALFAQHSAVSLNGGPAFPLYDPRFDLTNARWTFAGKEDWVLDRPAR